MALIQRHLDKYGVRRAEFARRAGVSPQTVQNWQDRPTTLPRPGYLRGVADIIELPYHRVLDAALTDAGYRHQPVDDCATVIDRITELVEIDPSALRDIAAAVSAMMVPLVDQPQSTAVDRIIDQRLRAGLDSDDGGNGGHQAR